MRIRYRARGTNQYRQRGELTGIDICAHCGAINDIEYFTDGAFPMLKKVSEYDCQQCKKHNIVK